MSTADQRELLRSALDVIPNGSAWSPAIIATIDVRHADAAKLYRRIGSKPLEAAAHLLAAEGLSQEGRSAQAAHHARQAHSFYEGVGAGQRLRQAALYFQATA
jgi:hypothetical protein